MSYRPLLLCVLAGCPGFGSEDPTALGVPHPVWADVEPILVTRCLPCHGEPSIGGAPDHFRLDRYDDTPSDLGAASLADRIVARAVDADPSVMPPGFPIDAPDAQTLWNWVVDGVPR